MSNFDDFNAELDHNIVIDQQRAQKTLPPSSTGESEYKPPEQEDAMSLGSSNYDLKNAAHPTACIATVGFKGLAFLFYMIGGFMSTVLLFILVTILAAMDFWVVKNITGRLLVGLRWWSDYDEKGKSIFKFESYDTKQKMNPVDQAFFWTGQLAFTIVWAVFMIIKILTLSPFWCLLVFINFFLCGMNLYGFYKCKGDHNKKIKNLKNEGIKNFVGKLF